MSLFSALNSASSTLAAQEAAIQVTGNNIANANTPGYARETVQLSSGAPTQIGNDNYISSGVVLGSVDRMVSEAMNQSLRVATADQTGSQVLESLLSRIQTTFGTLNSQDLYTQVNDFYNAISNLANNPQDSGQRSVVIQDGANLSHYIQNLRKQLDLIRVDTQSQVKQYATQASGFIQTVAKLNGQISTTESGGGNAAALRDQRDQALGSLSELMNIQVVDQGNGQLNVLSGSQPLVLGNTARTLSTQASTSGTGNLQVVFADTKDVVPVSSGKLGALMDGRDNFIDPTIKTLDTFAKAMIDTFNGIYTQGQGLTGFTDLTSTNSVSDSNAALNNAGLATKPVNGTFTFNVKNLATGQIDAQQIKVNLSGVDTQTTLSTLAASLSGGAITAAIDAAGHLQIKSSAPSNYSFSFSDDNSGVLSALGLNTFFTGKDAQSMDVNALLKSNADLLATGCDNLVGSNKNAQALALGFGATTTQLGGQSLKTFYENFIGQLASHTKTAQDEASAQGVIHDSLYAQQQSLSGVSMDEEAINLTKYQRAFQGSAKYITVLNDMIQTVLGLVR